MTENPTVGALIARSHRLGADPRNTNYAGGNTSAKGTETDPVTGEPVELLWVKGSGGDLGTLAAGGLAVLRLDRLRALVEVYPGVEREDEMVAAFEFCLHGKGGAAPSIDTAMHALVDAPHVDHLHPDSGIALATAADGEKLTHDCFGDRVVWIPWPPRITPIMPGLVRCSSAMSRPSWNPGRRQGTQPTRPPKHWAVSLSPSAAVANAIPESGCRWSTCGASTRPCIAVSIEGAAPPLPCRQ